MESKHQAEKGTIQAGNWVCFITADFLGEKKKRLLIRIAGMKIKLFFKLSNSHKLDHVCPTREDGNLYPCLMTLLCRWTGDIFSLFLQNYCNSCCQQYVGHEALIVFRCTVEKNYLRQDGIGLRITSYF